MKKICFLLAAALFLSVPAYAVQLENTHAAYCVVYSENVNNDPEAQAEMIVKLGLMHGPVDPNRLYKNIYRCDAAVLIVRFLGAEEQVKEKRWEHPFTDVPAWADRYVGWLYQNGLTRGVGDGRYGSWQYITYRQFAAMLSLAISGNDDFIASGIGTEDELNTAEANNSFLLAEAIGLFVRTLSRKYEKGGEDLTVAQYLVQSGAFTTGQLCYAAWGVLPSEYENVVENENTRLYRFVAGVPVAGCSEPNINPDPNSVKSHLDYLYASRVIDDKIVQLFRIDARTMNVLISGQFESTTCKGLDYLGTVNGVDYLMEEFVDYSGDGVLHRGALWKYDGELAVALSQSELWQENEPYANEHVFIAAENSLAITGTGRIFVFLEDGLHIHDCDTGSKLLYFDGKTIILQNTAEDETVISCMDSASGSLYDEYNVPNYAGYVGRTISFDGYNKFYGSAGLYVLDTETQRLRQVTSRPVRDVAYFMMDSRPVVLTYEYNSAGEEYAGDRVIQVDDDGTEIVLLDNNPPHGICFSRFESSLSSYVILSSDVEDFTIYYLLGRDGSLQVIDDRNEDTPENRREYIEKEKARLESLGY